MLSALRKGSWNGANAASAELPEPVHWRPARFDIFVYLEEYIHRTGAVPGRPYRLSFSCTPSSARNSIASI